MCIREFLGYRCGHRSVSVVRPCPTTTQRHDHPTCSYQPALQHLAETMCPACERILHTRWVLIREWEHRWLHERGICGCQVVFPGLIGPRVARPHNSNGTNLLPPERADPSYVPPLFEYVNDPELGTHVNVRISSVYAAEWTADHRAHHIAGRCSCPAEFHPFEPAVSDAELGADERTFLVEMRAMEALDPVADADEIVARRRALGIEDISQSIQRTYLPNYNESHGRDALRPYTGMSDSSMGSSTVIGSQTYPQAVSNDRTLRNHGDRMAAVLANPDANGLMNAGGNDNSNGTELVRYERSRVGGIPYGAGTGAPLNNEHQFVGPPSSSMMRMDSGFIKEEPEDTFAGPAYVVQDGNLQQIVGEASPMLFPPHNLGYAGLPIGSGPELMPHMRNFNQCRLHSNARPPLRN